MKITEIIVESPNVPVEEGVWNNVAKAGAWLLGKSSKKQALDAVAKTWGQMMHDATAAGNSAKNVKLDPNQLNKMAGGFIKNDPAFIAQAEKEAVKYASKLGGTAATQAMRSVTGNALAKTVLWGNRALNTYALAAPWWDYSNNMDTAQQWLKSGKAPNDFDGSVEEWYKIYQQEQAGVLLSRWTLGIAGGALSKWTLGGIGSVFKKFPLVGPSVDKLLTGVGIAGKGAIITLVNSEAGSEAIATVMVDSALAGALGRETGPLTDKLYKSINWVKSTFIPGIEKANADANINMTNTPSTAGKADPTAKQDQDATSSATANTASAKDKWVAVPDAPGMFKDPVTGDIKSKEELDDIK